MEKYKDAKIFQNIKPENLDRYYKKVVSTFEKFKIYLRDDIEIDYTFCGIL